MRIAITGYKIEVPGYKSVRFSASESYLDFDLVLLDLTLVGFQEYSQLPYNTSIENGLIEDCQRRHKEIIEGLKAGKTFICVLPSPQYMRNLFPFIEMLAGAELVVGSGTNIEFLGDPLFKDFYEANRKSFEYRSSFEVVVGTPFMFLKGTNRIVGSYLKVGEGNLLFVPGFASTTDFKRAIETLILSVRQLITDLHDRENSRLDPIPAWASAVMIPGENETLKKAESLQEEAKRLAAEVEEAENALVDRRTLKLLFSGKGDSLTNLVIRALNAVGVQATHGPVGRDDIIGSFEGLDLVFEVKGRKSSAAESDCAQLEKWRLRFADEHDGKMPKGVLIVNAFCETPLDRRTAPAFPNQMLKFAIGREHVLITATQLLELFFLAEENPNKGKEILRSLFATDGVFEGVPSFGSKNSNYRA